MSDFKAKMHQNSISAAAPPQTPLGELTALPPDLLAALKGPTSKGRERRERERMGREREEGKEKG